MSARQERLEQLRQDLKNYSFGKCETPGCKNRGVEAHHVITKNHTMYNPLARELSECEELMVWICEDCHHQAHTFPNTTRDTYLKLRAEQYGLEAVRAKITAIERAIGMNLKIDLGE